MIVVLTGGSGGAKFVQGLAQVVPAEELTCIVNTGDDLLWWELHVSPDLDSITYALAGTLSAERGWGVEGDTFNCLAAMKQLRAPAWFQLGDRDLATHLRRTQLLASGRSLSQATTEIAAGLGIRSLILPMSDDRVETRVMTSIGDLSFQEYFVREHYQIPVESVRFVGAEQARPAPGMLQAIENAEAVLIAPSNPITSIGPIVAIAEIREALVRTAARVLAISPIVSGAAVSGPAGALMQAHGLPVSAAGVVRCYGDFLDSLIIDNHDARAFGEIRSMGVATLSTNTIMKTLEDKVALARFALEHSVRATQSVYAKA
jgi:LPPG:FO 2-phospho-L-lactate transferase